MKDVFWLIMVGKARGWWLLAMVAGIYSYSILLCTSKQGWDRKWGWAINMEVGPQPPTLSSLAPSPKCSTMSHHHKLGTKCSNARTCGGLFTSKS